MSFIVCRKYLPWFRVLKSCQFISTTPLDSLIRDIDNSCNWRIYVEDGVTSNWTCSEQLTTLMKMRHNSEMQWECLVFQRDEACTNHKNTSIHTYLVFYIWSWYIYEIKMHIKYIYSTRLKQSYCWKPTQSRIIRTSQSSFTWWSMDWWL